MCAGDQVPGSAADALRLAHASLDYLNGPDAALLDPAALGPVLRSLGELRAKFTAAHAGFLRRFDAADAHDGDGYGTPGAWLAAMTKVSRKDANAGVRQMRQLGAHPALDGALAAGQLSPSWSGEIAEAAAPGPPPGEAHAALRHAIAWLAIDFVSGPAGIAALLRTRLLEPPYNTVSLPLDIG